MAPTHFMYSAAVLVALISVELAEGAFVLRLPVKTAVGAERCHQTDVSITITHSLELRRPPFSSDGNNGRRYSGAWSPEHCVYENRVPLQQLGFSTPMQSRRAVIASLLAPMLTTSLTSDNANAAVRGSTNSIEDEVSAFKLPSGLKYIDLVKNEQGISPAYGQLVSIAYKAYIKLPPTSKEKITTPQLYDEQSSFLYKHGNGRMIPGLDEGIHTMTTGSKRRIIIPPKLGYIDSGLGPLPVDAWNRKKLNSLLQEMVARVGGTVVFEVTLLGVRTDEGDLGYYQDDALTPEQFDILKNNLQKQAIAANAAAGGGKAAAVNIVPTGTDV
jgi:FKBP-type peptidyl-prolyl cis-trans isomerase